MHAKANHPKKTKGRPGIEVRHQRGCPTESGRFCNCRPSYRAWVYDRRAGGKIRKTFPTLAAAKEWRADATGQVRRGQLAAGSRRTLRDAAETWLAGAEADPPTVLTRGGRPYKPSVL